MEDLNFSGDLAGRDLLPPWNGVDWNADKGWEWTSSCEDTPEQLYALWGEAVARSWSAVMHALAERGLDGLSSTPSGGGHGLRRLLVDMIEEYSRHTGHADLIREAVDLVMTGQSPSPETDTGRVGVWIEVPSQACSGLALARQGKGHGRKAGCW